MIYSASMGPFIKKAFAEKGYQTNIKKLIELLSEHPDQSGMDAVVLGPKDLRWALGTALLEAIATRNPAIQIFYIYQKNKDEQLIEMDDVMKLQMTKLSPELIKSYIEEHMEATSISRNTRMVESKDNQVESYPQDEEEIVELEPAVDEVAATITDEVMAEEEKPKTLEQRIAELGQFADFDLLKNMLRKDLVLQDLLETNMQFADLLKMLDALDQGIQSVFTDDSLSAEQKFEKIKLIGVERAAFKGVESSLVADKTISIMNAVIRSAEATVEARMDSIRRGLDTISSAKLMYDNQEQLNELIDSRMRIQLELMELSKEMIELYKAMDHNVSEILQDIQNTKPSGNEFINEVMNSAQQYFVPQNMALVTNKLISDLQQNKLTFSIMEDKIKSCVNLVFKLCEEDATIIEYQQRLIRLLKTQRVENVVVIDNIIKSSLRLFVGAADVGTTATALTWSGIVSRRQNTLLLDLTGRAKLKDYGVEAISLDEFLAERIERPFLCVEGILDDDLELERVDEVVSELKTRLTYYAHLHILLDASQEELINRLARSALVIHYITDCTPRGTSLIHQVAANIKEENIAKKVILIDPPIDPIKLLSDMSLDPMTAKLVIIPKLHAMKACSIYHTKPYDNPEIVDIFEEAFR